MPRYFFHVHNDLNAVDEEGVELRDMAAVREYALKNARSLICESVGQGHVNLGHFILVQDDDGEEVLKLTFGEAFTIEG
jgi:hypothetical protein